MASATRRQETIPLVARFPALASIPRVPLGHYPTPVESLAALSPSLWIKRDDRSADPIGGNKVRALEFLLGGVVRDDIVVSVGSAGSTHALALATYAGRLGATVELGLWRQEMNPTATIVADRLAKMRKAPRVYGSPVGAYLWAVTQRLRGAKWIAAGGSNALGVLGHVNAGLELVDQIDAGLIPEPVFVVVPLGTGGTAAGLALAFAIAERKITVVGARVVPKIVARRSRVLALARGASRLITSRTGSKLPSPRPEQILIEHDSYGGAYGRETEDARNAAAKLAAVSGYRGVRLDGTYSAKAFAVALRMAGRAPTLFWLTFDSRILTTT